MSHIERLTRGKNSDKSENFRKGCLVALTRKFLYLMCRVFEFYTITELCLESYSYDLNDSEDGHYVKEVE